MRASAGGPDRHHGTRGRAWLVLALLVLPGVLLLAGIALWWNGLPEDAAAAREAAADADGAARARAAEQALAALPDLPPPAGGCAGWRRSLAGGDWRRAADVEACLRALAVADRAAAVAQARALRDWHLPMDGAADLALLVASLARFATDAEADAYLEQLGLVAGDSAPADAGDGQGRPALSIQDKLLRRGRVLAFDVETGFWPNHHDGLLTELAELAGPPLSAARFTEDAPPPDNPDDLPYRLTATLDGRTRTVQAKDYGDWFDVDAVLRLLDQLAADAGAAQRFVPLPTNDQTALVLVVPADALATALADGLVAIGAHDGALSTGKAAEAEFLARLRARQANDP